MTRTVRCPSCKASHADGAEFTVNIPYRAASSNVLVGIDEQGQMVLGVGDSGYPSEFGTPELECGSCGYQWRTRRDWT